MNSRCRKPKPFHPGVSLVVGALAQTTKFYQSFIELQLEESVRKLGKDFISLKHA